ncbi:AMP-dependent synthetase [Betaproteobacteria bacterium GR16-43]|nr:AMP-dependent synthetase [Betaproteobacteria bacterium GR16-43]
MAFLTRAAREGAGRTAIFLGTSPWASYGELARRVAALAAGLGRLGLVPGDRVLLLQRNAPEYLEAMYAAWWAGLAAVPVNAKLHPREVRHIAGDSAAKVLFAGPEWREGLAAALDGLEPPPRVIESGGAEYRAMAGGSGNAEPAAVAPGDLAWLFYTSGTTGRPKGAMLSHANLAGMTASYFASVDEVPREGRLLHAAPMSHGSGLYTFTHLARGAAQVVPESGGFEAAEVLLLLETHREVTLFAAPTMVRRLTDAARASGLRAPGLRTLVYGGGPMYRADIRDALDVFGPRFAQIYGQGESPMTITALDKEHHADAAHPRHEQRLASVGRAHDGIEVAIRGDDGRGLAVGEVGEICVRGPTVMSGYWKDPEASARALRDGWLWTGDLGALDADGFLTLKDRSKDLIISGGSNIYPREVEEVLLAHPAVAEASVVGRPDPDWGESVVAFVVARGTRPAPAELDGWCLEHIARFKRPKEYRFLDALPKNHYGKVLKSELRRQLSQVNGGAASRAVD